MEDTPTALWTLVTSLITAGKLNQDKANHIARTLVAIPWPDARLACPKQAVLLSIPPAA